MKVLRTVNGVKVLEDDLKNFTIKNKRVMSILNNAKKREEQGDKDTKEEKGGFSA